MRDRVVVVDANEEHRRKLCTTLQGKDFSTDAIDSLTNLGEKIKEIGCRVLILDLDSLPVDNHFIKNFRKENPTVHIVGLSGRAFHPELKEALTRHIHACLGKPVDEDELIVWVKSLFEINETY